MTDAFLSEAVFWVLAAGAAGFALLVVSARTPVSSALSLACSMISTAGLMVCLGAAFLAAAQVLVYAGAVIVLFLFIIMLMDAGGEKGRRRGAAGVLGGLGLVALIGYGGMRALMPLAGKAAAAAVAGSEVRRLGRLLFTDYVLALEATGVLLLVAMVGVLVLCRPGGPGGERGDS